MSVTLRDNVGSIGHIAGTWTAYPYTFRAGNLPNYSAYQALFDQYRINAVKLTFTPYWDNNDLGQQGSTTVAAMPRVYTIIDRNGIGPGSIATEDLMLEYGNCRQITRPGQPFSIYIKSPGIETDVEVSGVGVPAMTMYKKFLDTNTGTVDHFGCAIGWIQPGVTGTTSFNYHVVATYYLQFKTIR